MSEEEFEIKIIKKNIRSGSLKRNIMSQSQEIKAINFNVVNQFPYAKSSNVIFEESSINNTNMSEMNNDKPTMKSTNNKNYEEKSIVLESKILKAYKPKNYKKTI